jgi:hypothetical protein
LIKVGGYTVVGLREPIHVGQMFSPGMFSAVSEAATPVSYSSMDAGTTETTAPGEAAAREAGATRGEDDARSGLAKDAESAWARSRVKEPVVLVPTEPLPSGTEEELETKFASGCDTSILSEPLYTFPAIRCYLKEPFKTDWLDFLKEQVRIARGWIRHMETAGHAARPGISATPVKDSRAALEFARDTIARQRSGLGVGSDPAAVEAVNNEIFALEWCLGEQSAMACGEFSCTSHACWTDVWQHVAA